MLARDVSVLLEAVPEFVDRFLDLVEAADGDPGGESAFSELADFVADLLAKTQTESAVEAQRLHAVLGRCLAGLERVAEESADAEELVGWAFLDSLCPADAERLSVRFGPRTFVMAESLGVLPAAGPPVSGRARQRSDRG